jgi:hypothetical protein
MLQPGLKLSISPIEDISVRLQLTEIVSETVSVAIVRGPVGINTACCRISYINPSDDGDVGSLRSRANGRDDVNKNGGLSDICPTAELTAGQRSSCERGRIVTNPQRSFGREFPKLRCKMESEGLSGLNAKCFEGF